VAKAWPIFECERREGDEGTEAKFWRVIDFRGELEISQLPGEEGKEARTYPVKLALDWPEGSVNAGEDILAIGI
jgi:hypothetical protein